MTMHLCALAQSWSIRSPCPFLHPTGKPSPPPINDPARRHLANGSRHLIDCNFAASQHRPARSYSHGLGVSRVLRTPGSSGASRSVNGRRGIFFFFLLLECDHFRSKLLPKDGGRLTPGSLAIPLGLPEAQLPEIGLRGHGVPKHPRTALRLNIEAPENSIPPGSIIILLRSICLFPAALCSEDSSRWRLLGPLPEGNKKCKANVANGEGMAIKPVGIEGHLPIVRSGVVLVHQLEHLHYRVFDADQRPVKVLERIQTPCFLGTSEFPGGSGRKGGRARRRPCPSQSGKTIW